jgi:hypothetical protein
MRDKNHRGEQDFPRIQNGFVRFRFAIVIAPLFFKMFFD